MLGRLATAILRRRVGSFYCLEGDAFDGLDGPFCVSFSQEGEDLRADELLGRPSSGFYVDVGALHPVRFSNTYRFYRRGWSGVNIEPSPGASEAFRRVRPRDLTLGVGVSDSSRAMTLYLMNDPALNTFDRDRVASLEATTAFRCVGAVEVSARPLRDVLAETAERRPIDLLSIDVERHELLALQSSDWDRFRPTLVLVENLDHSLLERLQEDRVHQFMKSVKYELVAKTMRTAFYWKTEARR